MCDLVGAVTGPELALLRKAAGVRAGSVAEELQVNPSTVTRLEQRTVVRSVTQLRYRDALERAIAAQARLRNENAMALVDAGLALASGGSSQ